VTNLSSSEKLKTSLCDHFCQGEQGHTHRLLKLFERAGAGKMTLDDYVLKQSVSANSGKNLNTGDFKKRAALQPLNNFDLTCGFLLHPPSRYASLPPVSQTFAACKHLKVQHLKLNFNSPEVFHNTVENSVENSQREWQKECFCNTF
jgi:hypothetical protein